MADERFISKHSSTEIEAMLDKVKEDMRVIQYSQAEINTLLTKIDGMTQPTKVSDINNDLGFIDNTVNNLVHYYTKTNTYTKDEVNALITAQTSGGFISVNTLPTEDISVHHIYLVPGTNSGTNNIKDEYINLDGTSNGWELIGSTQLDLSNYVSVTALNSALLDYVTSTGLTNILDDYYTKTQVDGLFDGKADKVSGAISGHLVALDSNGNLTDAGKALSDLQGNFNYSLDEKVVGTWIDDSPLYQRTFEVNAATYIESDNRRTFTATVISNATNINMIASEGSIYLDGFEQTISFIGTGVTRVMSVSISNSLQKDDSGNLNYYLSYDKVNVTPNITSIHGYITVRYTKITD